MTAKRKPVLVLGGTGKTGSRVAERLWFRGARIRLGSRRTEPPFDWERPATWEPALEGVEAVYVCYYPDLAAPAALPAVRSFAELAVARGARRLVLLSGRGEPGALRCEEAVRESGADWTILRASWFDQNFSESFLRDVIVGGAVALPVGDVGEPFVDVDDIADVATAAFLDDRHVGEVYELTGPRPLTFAEAIAEIAHASGRAIDFARVAPRDYSAALERAGVPAEFAKLVTYLFTELVDGRNSAVCDGVERALGRRPADFRDYARACAARGVWAPRARRDAAA
jgi:uncharacterized protein YbjT (DUF2867 family)